MSLERVVGIHSGQARLCCLRQNFSPGRFVKSNNALDSAACQTLLVVNCSDSRHFPWMLRNELIRRKRSKFQLVKVAIYKLFSELNISTPESRQR